MPPLVDKTTFQLGLPPDLDPEEELEERLELGRLWERANGYVEKRAWAPYVSEVLLAYGIGEIFGLFLVRFSTPPPSEVPDERERWFVIGDMPPMNFETDGIDNPKLAMQLYCELAEEWSEAVLSNGDTSQCYPIEAAPTAEHAEMLLSRVAFIRNQLIPAYLDQVDRLRRSRNKVVRLF